MDDHHTWPRTRARRLTEVGGHLTRGVRILTFITGAHGAWFNNL
jgi:hypothetical protein